jgi:phi LC3 family holin
MNINWKARLKNKVFIFAFGTLAVSFVYQILGLFGIVPSISQDDVMNIITTIINGLAALGVIVDPTTPGASDSDRAMTYYTDNDVRTIE